MKLSWLVPTLVLVAGCGSDPAPAPSADLSVSGSAPVPTGYVEQVNVLCRDLLADVMTFDIGNAVTIEQFLGKHEPLVAAIRAFDAQVDALPVTEAERPAADAFDAYRAFSDSADAAVVAAAETGNAAAFEAANIAYLETIRTETAEIDAMHAAGIECNAR